MSFKEVDNHTSDALQLLEEENYDALTALLVDLHPVELTNLLTEAPPEQLDELLKRVSGLDQIASLFTYGNDLIHQKAIALLDDMRLAAVIRRVEFDDGADVIALLPRRRQISVLRRVAPETAREITKLLAYNEETAGGIMTTLFATLPPNLTAKEALEQIHIRLAEEDIDPDTDIQYIYVVDGAECLEGICSLRQILSAEPSTKLSELMSKNIVTVHPDDDQEKVARLISDYDFYSIPVVAPESDVLLGIITVDDVLDVIEEEHTEDILKLAGTVEEDIIGATVTTAVRSRLPWLVASCLGGLGGAVLLGQFETALQQIVTLAFFMPVVFGMAGNVGSQSSTITVRGIATGELSKYRTFARLRKEIFTGFLLGIIFGSLLSSTSFALYRDLTLSLTVGLSILLTMTSAATFGAMLPVLFNKFKIDPAVASGPLVTTSTDILSITIYFSVASTLLLYL